MLAYSDRQIASEITEVEAERYLAEDPENLNRRDAALPPDPQVQFNQFPGCSSTRTSRDLPARSTDKTTTSPTFLSSSRASSLATSSVAFAINIDDAVARHDALRRDFDTREAGLVRCRAGGDTQHEHALASGQRKQALIELFVHLNAQRRTDVLTGLDELRDYAHDGVHRHGETNPAGRGAGGP